MFENPLILLGIMLTVASPFAFIGAFFLFKIFIEFIMIRRGNVKMLLFTGSKQVKTALARPINNLLTAGKSTYKFDHKKIFRWGWAGTPTIAYNEDSIEPLDPLEAKSRLSSVRLSEIQIRWFNLGVISTMKREKLLQVLVIILVGISIGALFFSFLAYQSNQFVESNLKGYMNEKFIELNNTLSARPQNSQPTTNTTPSIPVIG